MAVPGRAWWLWFSLHASVSYFGNKNSMAIAWDLAVKDEANVGYFILSHLICHILEPSCLPGVESHTSVANIKFETMKSELV